MKYLFFDIECSNCFNGVGKMCEFGYVLTDEKFNVISSDDIPMSPGKGRGDRFHLRDRMKVEDVRLAYDEDYYFEQPELPSFYERIKKLMEDKDTICFAFSMSNDIRYLFDSCARYGLPSLDYNCYDIQKLAASYLEVNGQPGLKKCVEEIVGPHANMNLIEHLSRDDAMMEMKILDAICALNQVDSKTLLENSDFAKVNSIEFIKDFQAGKTKKMVKKELREFIVSKATEDFELAKTDEYKGKRYGISSKAYSNIDECKRIIELIHQSQGLYTMKYDLTDTIIVKDEEDLLFLKNKTIESYKGEFILLADFVEIITK